MERVISGLVLVVRDEGMPVANYKCDACGKIFERDVAMGESFTSICDETGTMQLVKRQWQPIGIGRVDGAGGSPAR